MNDFKKTGDKISFNVIINDSIIYLKPITPFQQINDNTLWENRMTYEVRQYDGVINGDTIVIKTEDFDQRMFV